MGKFRELSQAARKYWGNQSKQTPRRAGYHRTLRFEKVEERRMLQGQALIWAPQPGSLAWGDLCGAMLAFIAIRVCAPLSRLSFFAANVLARCVVKVACTEMDGKLFSARAGLIIGVCAICAVAMQSQGNDIIYTVPRSVTV